MSEKVQSDINRVRRDKGDYLVKIDKIEDNTSGVFKYNKLLQEQLKNLSSFIGSLVEL